MPISDTPREPSSPEPPHEPSESASAGGRTSVDVGPPPGGFMESIASMGLELEGAEIASLRRFLTLLLETNQTTNLTAITEPEQAWVKHILDAMTLVPILATLGEQVGGEAGVGDRAAERSSIGPEAGRTGAEHARRVRVADVGSGGGVPAIPLAIVMSDVEFTLVEATGKKADFLRQACVALRLSNVTVVNERAEVVGQSRQHREQYDAAIARALGHLAIVCELCAPLVRPSGIVIAVKGQKAGQELQEAERALGLLGLRHVDTSETPTGRLVLLEKTTRTPRIYPRGNGEPARVPLGVPRGRPGRAS